MLDKEEMAALIQDYEARSIKGNAPIQRLPH